MWLCSLYVGSWVHLTKRMWASEHPISSPNDVRSQTREERVYCPREMQKRSQRVAFTLSIKMWLLAGHPSISHPGCLRGCDLWGFIELQAKKGPMLGLMSVLSNFWTRVLHFHFALSPKNSVANLVHPTVPRRVWRTWDISKISPK